MNVLSRQREMDLIPTVQLMTVRIEHALFQAACEIGRPADDIATAGLLALAQSAAALRSAFSIPVSVWAEANRLASDPTSLTSSLPPLPATRVLEARVAPGAPRKN